MFHEFMLNQLTIKQASEKLRDKEISSLELTRACFDRIKERQKDVNAFITITEKEALEQAEAIDKRLKLREKVGDLAGVPVAIKDNILTFGIKTTAGSKMLENYVAPYDATVVKKLKEAGAVILGKTNLDEFAMGSSTENSYFGPVKNPHNLEMVPGGSSGGSAAAVADNQSIFALGSDTGGSIRQPASFCGVVGLKPTYGAVSRYGLIAMASSLDQIGPIAKTVEDCKIVFDAIRGKDLSDSTSVESGIMNHESGTRNLRIGIPNEYFGEAVEPEIDKIIRDIILGLDKKGAEVKEASLPNTSYALPCYYIIMPAEVSANLARYDGIKYGYQASIGDKDDYINICSKNRSSGFGMEVKRRIILGVYTLSAGYYDAYYKKAQQARSMIKKDFEEAFKKFDVLITPVSPTPAFRFGEKIIDPLKMYLSDVHTVPINLAGVPAISIPCGKTKNGLPVGIQVIGKWFDEGTLFEVAKRVEEISVKRLQS